MLRITYIVAQHVGKSVASKDGDFVIVRRYHEGRVGSVYPRVDVCHTHRGQIVALPGDDITTLEPGLVLLHGDLGHLQGTLKQLGGAVHGLTAVEMKAAVDCALLDQAVWVWDLNVAAPCRVWAAGAPCHRDDVGGSEHPHGHLKAEEKKP